MTTPRTPTSGTWIPAAELPPEPLTVLDGVEVGDGVSLDLLLGPKSAVGSRYFRLHLVNEPSPPSQDAGISGEVNPLSQTLGEGEEESTRAARTVEPVIFGLENHGPYPGFNWVEVLLYQDVLSLPDGRKVQVPDGVERRIFERLAALIPPGGHLMAEYDSPAREVTARALAARVPPRATPLGVLLAAVGCGDAFRDWYIPEGGREGPRKLQGFRAIDEEHARRRGLEMIEQLEAFLARRDDMDWTLQAKTRVPAQDALVELRKRFGVGAARG